MVGDREKLLAHGFNGYLSKPINPQTFMDEMAPYLHKTQSAVMKLFVAEKTTPVEPTEGTILVVDNSPVNITLSRSMLEPFGYKIIEAHGVDEAMTMLEEQRPDLILSDLHMPAKDGFDFIQEVKADAELSKIPFVFISSTVWGDRERDRGLSLGADQFLIRPIEPQALVAEIESSRSRKQGT
jgi:two-component system cell cycle response regulator